MNREISALPARRPAPWLKIVLIALVLEKIIQHIAVTAAFYMNTKDIRSTVVVNPDVLMVLGAVVALLFILSLWGLLTRKRWALPLVAGLALFDIAGEFVAQGKVFIVITVSFLVAVLLLALTLLYRSRQRLNPFRS